MTSPNTPAPASLPAKRRKSGRWWKILLSLVVVVLLLILLAPTLLSTGLGKNFILGKVNKSMPGKITADALSLGWFSGASVTKLEMFDAQGKSVVSLDKIDTGITAWAAVAGSVVPLDIVTNGKMAQLPGVTVSVHIVGSADLGKKTIAITGDSTIAAADEASAKRTMLTLASGSKLSWGQQPNDIHATLAYDWEQLQKIVQSSLPEGTVLSGQRTAQLHITGALTQDKGLRAMRGISIDLTAIGFDQVATKGIDMGKADIPFHMTGGILTLTPTAIPANGGTLQVLGKVDFNADPPAYMIEKRAEGNQLVKGLALNHDIAAGPLNFLPLVWGDKTGNLAAVGGQVNVQIAEAYIPLDSAAYKTKGTISGTLNVTNVSTDFPFMGEALKNLGPLMKITQPDLFTIRGGTIPDVPFALANGKVTYQNLRLGTDKANITFSGSVGLDTSLAMTMEATAKKTNIPIPIGLKGTTTKPEITITGLGAGNPEDQGKALLDQLLKKKK